MTDGRLSRIGPAIVRRLGLARMFNYTHPLIMGKRRFTIPILGGTGEGLLKLQPDFKSEIFQIFANDLPDVFIDIGANLGQTILEAFSQRDWQSFYAFEPSPHVCGYLEVLVKANRLPVKILPWAAGRTASPHNFCAKGPADASATLAPEARPGVYQPDMSSWVAVYPLDSLAEAVALPSGLMIKIDVEGFEPDVLEGANKVLADLRPLILCEVLRAYRVSEVEPADARMSRIEATLARHRYRIIRLEMENETDGPIKALREVPAFPRGLYHDNPSGMDYLFVPVEKRLPHRITLLSS